MGLRVNTNIAALNASRVLRRSTLDLNRSLERLSSGLRINRAAEDAAGEVEEMAEDAEEAVDEASESDE